MIAAPVTLDRSAYVVTWRLADGSRGHVACIAPSWAAAIRMAPVCAAGATMSVRRVA